MPWPLLEILFALPVFALILLRISGLMLTAPVLSSGIIPIRVRAAFAVALAAMLFPVVARYAPRDLTLGMAMVGAVGELAIGATIGLALTVMMMGAELTGVMVGQQAGLALGQVFDPTQNRQSTVVAQLYTISLTLLFLSVGGHREMMAALLDTFEAIPLMAPVFDDSAVLLFIESLTAAFIMAIRVSGPVLIALFMLAVAMGFLSRTMPQFNILSVGFTLRVMVAIGAAGLTLMACREVLVDSIWNSLDLVRSWLQLDSVGGGGAI